jgi:hypothetical protein
MRYRKGDLAHNLMCAAQHFIHANKGTAVVMGPIQVIEMPGARPGCYTIGVACLGQKPVNPVKEK